MEAKEQNGIPVAIVGNRGQMGNMLQQRLQLAGFSVRGIDLTEGTALPHADHPLQPDQHEQSAHPGSPDQPAQPDSPISPNSSDGSTQPNHTDSGNDGVVPFTPPCPASASHTILPGGADVTEQFREQLRMTVKECRVVLLCVPVTALEPLMAMLGPLLRSDQLLMDITSVKTIPMQLMEKFFKGPIVGSHPLFGPNPLPEDMRTILVRGTHASDTDCALAERLFAAISSRTHWASAEEHDRGVAIAQSLNFTVSAAFFSTLNNIADIEYFLTPSFKRHLEAARKHLTMDTDMFLEFSSMNPFFETALTVYESTLNRVINGDLEKVAHEARHWYISGAGPK